MQSWQDPMDHFSEEWRREAQALKSDIRVIRDFGEVEDKRLRQMENTAGLEQVTWGDWSSPWLKSISHVQVIDGQVAYTCKVQGDSDKWVFYGNDVACGYDLTKDVRVIHGRLLVIGAKYHYPTGHPRFESVWLTWGDFMTSGFAISDLELYRDGIVFSVQLAFGEWKRISVSGKQAGALPAAPP